MPMNVTLFGNRAFSDESSKDEVILNYGGPHCNVTGVLTREETQTQREEVAT